MNFEYSSNLWSIMVCPYCHGQLQSDEAGVVCSDCRQQYHYSEAGALDFRLKQPKYVPYEFQVGAPVSSHSYEQIASLHENPNPDVDFSAIEVPYHLSNELMSHFPSPQADGALMLDLGCGDTVHRSVCEYAGFEYVGLDYTTPQAQLLGDGQALPFADNSFEFVLSIAVLEHIQFPFVLTKEVTRVLKSNGRFIGTVSFLEPFHGDSYYHHTHLGVYNSLQASGLIIDAIAPSANWSGTQAIAEMGFYPRMPSILSRSIMWLPEFLSRQWWRLGRLRNPDARESIRIRNTTGSFAFVAHKRAL